MRIPSAKITCNSVTMLKSSRLIRFLGILLDPTVRIPLTWPLGKYGLPMAKSGCPNGGFWHTGWRYHDTEDKDPSNYWSNPYDLAGHVGKSNMEQKFCMKIRFRTSTYNLPWPKGKYCIFKKEYCPAG